MKKSQNPNELNKEIEEAMKHITRSTSPDPEQIESAKAKFLKHADDLRKEMSPVKTADKLTLLDSITIFTNHIINTYKRKVVMKPYLLALSLVLIFAFTGGGVALAANGAEPGDLLYSLDRSLEDLQLTFTGTPERELDLYFKLSKERLTEFETLAREENTVDLEFALNEYLASLDQISTALKAGNSEVADLVGKKASLKDLSKSFRASFSTLALETQLTLEDLYDDIIDIIDDLDDDDIDDDDDGNIDDDDDGDMDDDDDGDMDDDSDGDMDDDDDGDMDDDDDGDTDDDSDGDTDDDSDGDTDDDDDGDTDDDSDGDTDDDSDGDTDGDSDDDSDDGSDDDSDDGSDDDSDDDEDEDD